ncbi:hypothetical protein J4H86_15030 [Spiractinospora alimapuensis]|uniref:hypothetical protein n=1 Tax=Spiractinospora alimapuensis TaxID=2820884 RepID=UPI001F2DF58C|nr:hypothetical protein [Spiractinospora alimapuensis]QVQ50264.1 hypothetical protein J4H86_15030 [Spiractinospora alimapuensis]
MSTFYTYPWDVVGDPGAAERIAGLSTQRVAVAAAYHSARAATPHHPRHRMVDVRHAASYVPVRRHAWRDSRLVPAPAPWVDGENPYGSAQEALRAAGLLVDAWVVLTHSTRLGTEHPDLTVRNAFGDRYRYALCPAAPDVVDYCERLVTEVVGQTAPDGVVLEACGPLGASHGGHHEKTDGAEWGPVELALLSLCFCGACRARYTDVGVDPEALADRVRAGVDGPTRPASVEEALGEYAETVRALRASLVSDLAERLVERVRELAPGTRVTMHAASATWATGPFATVAQFVPAVDCLVGTCWTPTETATAELAALRALAPPNVDVGAYVLGLPPTPADPDHMRRLLEAYSVAGASEFHMYHAGLASRRRLTAMRTALRAHDGTPTLDGGE